jgi:UDP-N-acetylmuramoyl-tripeptide--D-alanyl-D-alanine ligase
MDNPYNPIILAKAKKGGVNVLGFARHQRADFQIINVEYKDGKSYIAATCLDKNIQYVMNVLGEHIILNSIAVIAVVHALGLECEFAARQLEQFSLLAGRGMVRRLRAGITIVDESYNASPASVQAAITSAKYYKADGRFILLLGDMLELGTFATAMHLELLSDIMANEVDLVYTVGNLSKVLNSALPQEIAAGHYDNADELAAYLPKKLMSGDVVLIKGSRSIKMEKVLKAIIEYWE